MRIATHHAHQTAVSHTLNKEARVYDLTKQLDTGKKVNVPSDNVTAFTIAALAKSKIGTNEADITTAQRLQHKVEAQNTALAHGADVLKQAKENILQLMDPSINKDTIISSVKQLVSDFISIINTKDQGKYIFNQFNDDTPLSETGKNFVVDHTNQYIINNTKIEGAPNAQSILGESVSRLVDSMDSENMSEIIDGLDYIISNVTTAQAQNGILHKRLDNHINMMTQNNELNHGVIRQLVDANVAEVSMELTQAQREYQAYIDAYKILASASIIE